MNRPKRGGGGRGNLGSMLLNIFGKGGEAAPNDFYNSDLDAGNEQPFRASGPNLFGQSSQEAGKLNNQVALQSLLGSDTMNRQKQLADFNSQLELKRAKDLQLFGNEQAIKQHAALGNLAVTQGLDAEHRGLENQAFAQANTPELQIPDPITGKPLPFGDAAYMTKARAGMYSPGFTSNQMGAQGNINSELASRYLRPGLQGNIQAKQGVETAENTTKGLEASQTGDFLTRNPGYTGDRLQTGLSYEKAKLPLLQAETAGKRFAPIHPGVSFDTLSGDIMGTEPPRPASTVVDPTTGQTIKTPEQPGRVKMGGREILKIVPPGQRPPSLMGPTTNTSPSRSNLLNTTMQYPTQESQVTTNTGKPPAPPKTKPLNQQSEDEILTLLRRVMGF